ncbi:hypothetical protein C1T17_15165 [Sphingobium sp. SCG-1]|uniref:hypothetical protein n=1 Tax=Sphingobium sp. SCG-1 TaxID=2072936 RepID=UPI000CD6A992|nr:hypothetical protein [Sphingobium sp. SCG-1]AUW59229.1 hypothetical protein C1T17_15165 [Sphingobium sp. SCG-1]
MAIDQKLPLHVLVAFPKSRHDRAMLKASASVILFLGSTGCSDTCENSVAARVASPDGQREAVMFQRDCGATTGYSTQISVLDNGETPAGGGKAFRADDNHGVAAVGESQGPWADMRWVAPDRLLIRYASKSRVFEQATDLNGVTIDYQQVAQ